jgi:hypothetical protein
VVRELELVLGVVVVSEVEVGLWVRVGVCELYIEPSLPVSVSLGAPDAGVDGVSRGVVSLVLVLDSGAGMSPMTPAVNDVLSGTRTGEGVGVG